MNPCHRRTMAAHQNTAASPTRRCGSLVSPGSIRGTGATRNWYSALLRGREAHAHRILLPASDTTPSTRCRCAMLPRATPTLSMLPLTRRCHSCDTAISSQDFLASLGHSAYELSITGGNDFYSGHNHGYRALQRLLESVPIYISMMNKSSVDRKHHRSRPSSRSMPRVSPSWRADYDTPEDRIKTWEVNLQPMTGGAWPLMQGWHEFVHDNRMQVQRYLLVPADDEPDDAYYFYLVLIFKSCQVRDSSSSVQYTFCAWTFYENVYEENQAKYNIPASKQEYLSHKDVS